MITVFTPFKILFQIIEFYPYLQSPLKTSIPNLPNTSSKVSE